MENHQILSALREGALRLEGQFIYGSNYTFMASCKFGGETIKAVYKPLQGERPLWDFPHQTLARREVVAFLISDAIGWKLVPPTVFRTKKSPMGPGSVQLFIDHNPDYHYFNFLEKDKIDLDKVMLFDLLINNADRKGGHLLIDPEEKLWLIDHGLSFHVEDKLRTVVWEHAGKPISNNLLADIIQFISLLSPGSLLTTSLQPHLLPAEIKALKKRAETLVNNSQFPLPPEDRRAYPWPLV